MKKNKLKIISDAICGIATLISILVYLIIGVFANLWHPTWLIVVITEILCAILTIIVGTYIQMQKINNKNKPD